MQPFIQLSELFFITFLKIKYFYEKLFTLQNKLGSNAGEVRRMNGLYEGHAYSIVDIKEVRRNSF